MGPEPIVVDDISEEPDYVRGRQILPDGALKLAHNIMNYIGLGAPGNCKLWVLNCVILTFLSTKDLKYTLRTRFSELEVQCFERNSYIFTYAFFEQEIS